MDTVWKTALAIGAAQLVLFVLYKVYKKWQRTKSKRKQRAMIAKDLQNSVFRISSAAGLRSEHPHASSSPDTAEMGETAMVGNNSSGLKAIHDLAMILNKVEK